MNNPPTISLYNLANNEVNGTIKINATVFDLDNDISADGVEFYISTDKETWTLLGNDPIGAPSNTNDQNIYEITWDTTYVPDNMYWLKVSVQDLTNNINSDVSQEYIIVHNNRDNPPIIKFKEPRMNLPLGQIEPIVVEVIDFENDVDGVSFYYSKDNRTWEIIDTRDKPEKNDLYRIIWSTSEINNGWYYIKVKARDSSGHSSEVTTGPFEVTEGKEPGSQSKDASGFLGLIISVITIIIIILLLIVMLIRRSKKREKKLIEEVASELRHTMELETEGEQEGIDNDNDLVGYPSETPDNTAVQTYIPSTNVSAQVPQINNVEPNPQLPPPSANVNVNATGTVNMAQPVQGTEDMPMTSEPIPVHMPETPEAPPEMELPPEIDLPPLDEPEIPISPYVAG